MLLSYQSETPCRSAFEGVSWHFGPTRKCPVIRSVGTNVNQHHAVSMYNLGVDLTIALSGYHITSKLGMSTSSIRVTNANHQHKQTCVGPCYVFESLRFFIVWQA